MGHGPSIKSGAKALRYGRKKLPKNSTENIPDTDIAVFRYRFSTFSFLINEIQSGMKTYIVKSIIGTMTNTSPEVSAIKPPFIE